jgi:flagellar biogenesis protein FliO
MKSTPKWFLIPPAIAVLLILGPMSMGGSGDKNAASQGSGSANIAAPANSQSTNEPSKARSVPGSLVPRTPDMWKMSSALVGVLLLGAGALIVLKRMRGGAVAQGKTSLATLRQTVRLTAKQSLHAIEFDNRILLIGESDKGLTLLNQGSLPEAVNDEATVMARYQEAEPQEEEGAVPRNLLIPRPETAQQRSKPLAPSAPANAARASTPSKADAAIAKLNDFRNLLEKAGR